VANYGNGVEGERIDILKFVVWNTSKEFVDELSEVCEEEGLPFEAPGEINTFPPELPLITRFDEISISQGILERDRGRMIYLGRMMDENNSSFLKLVLFLNLVILVFALFFSIKKRVSVVYKI